MYARIAILLSLILAAMTVKGQFDTNYVHITKNQFTAYPMVETAFMELRFTDLDKDDWLNSSKFTSRNTTSIGFGMSFQRVGFSLSFQIPYSDIAGLKNSKALSITGGLSYHRFYGELRYRNYKGFEKEDIYHDSNLGYFYLRKDINMRQIGVMANYFFSSKYNFDASYKNYNIQKKPAASFFILAGINRYDASGKYLFWDSLQHASSIELIREMNIWQIKLAPGGAYTVTHKNFYISSMIAVGPSYSNNYIFGDENKEVINTWAPFFEARAVIGYNSTKWFASLSFNFENDYFFYKHIDLSVVNLYFNLKGGLKFNSKRLGKVGKYL